jgi:ADP-ribosylglycohydrolase
MDGQDRVRGCLLGGAVGDALGAPIEFASLREIRKHHGPDGVTGYVADWRGKTGLITDDTQMTLFTVEGLVLADHASGSSAAVADGAPMAASPGAGDTGVAAASDAEVVEAVRQAYLRWYDTQSHDAPPPADLPHRTGRLREEGWLYSRRAPGNACLSGLRRPFLGPSPLGEPGPVNPDSKGCGTVMRSAPFGLFRTPSDPRAAFETAAACAQITHGHPTGYLAAGAFAAIIAYLMAGEDLEPAVHRTLELLAGYRAHEETTAALRAALELGGPPSPERVESLGGAWASTAPWPRPPSNVLCCCRSTTPGTVTRPARCAATCWARCAAPLPCRPPGCVRWKAATRSSAWPPSWPDHRLRWDSPAEMGRGLHAKRRSDLAR